jgi:hypothetical protein
MTALARLDRRPSETARRDWELPQVILPRISTETPWLDRTIWNGFCTPKGAIGAPPDTPFENRCVARFEQRLLQDRPTPYIVVDTDA